MPNQYVNKVVKSDGTTLIDLTSDTVTSAAHIISGRVGHLADGSVVTGTAETGGGTGIRIGIANTPIPNILNMFYALENGTAKTGEFTLSQAIPNTSTLIFDTGLSTVNGLFIADETMATQQTGATPENTLWAIVFNPTSNTGSYAMTRITHSMTYGTNQNGVNRGFLNRVYAWEVTDGKLYVTGQYNRNSNYTPFYPGRTYRWVAW